MTPKSRIRDKRDPELVVVGDTYYYRGTPIPGRGEIERSLKVSSKNRGLAVQAKKEMLIKLRGVDPKTKVPLIRDLYLAVMAQKEARGRRPKTLESAEMLFKAHLMPHFGNYPVTWITDDVWGEYVKRELKLKNRKLSYDRKYLNQLLIYAQKKGFVTRLPELPIPKETREGRLVMTPSEIKSMYENASHTFKGIILFGYKMGMRPPKEITSMSWSKSINFKKNTLTIFEEDTKANPRTIHMNKTCVEWLHERLAKQKARGLKTDWVFHSKHSATKRLKGINSTWNRLAANCGVREAIVPYCLRHTFLTEAARRVRTGTASIVDVCGYAGTSIKMFEEHYLHTDGEDTRAVADLMNEGGAI